MGISRGWLPHLPAMTVLAKAAAQGGAELRMSWMRALLFVAWAGTLSGCASYTPEPISASENARALDSRSLDDPRLQQFVSATVRPDGKPESAPTWDLTTLTVAALYYHPDLQLAQAKLAAAQASVITAGESPNPVFNFTNMIGQGVVAGAIPAGAAPLTIGPVIDFVIETFGKRESRTAQAQHLADAARFDLATAAWQVRGGVRTALLNLWAAQQRLALTRRRLEIEDQLVELLEHRLAVGEASALDVTHERINRAQVTLAQQDLEQTAAEARVQLATAVGIPVQALDGVDVTTNAFEHPSPIAPNSDWRREALTQRTDVRASLEAYGAAQAALQLAVAGQFPNVTLSPGYNYEYGINEFVLNLDTTLPIFNQNQGPIAEALAKRLEAAAAFAALQAQIIGAVDLAATAYRKSTQTLASANALLADEQRRVLAMENSFRAGQVDRPTLVTVQMEAAATALAGFDAVVKQRQALGALEDALQRPLYGPDVMLSLPQVTLRPPSESSS
jgi:outer membrane protein, heavy metal efflux system